MCGEFFDENEDQATRDAAAKEAREREAKKLNRQTEAQRREAILDAAVDADRRRGRRGLVLSGVAGDPSFGTSVATTSAYSLTPGTGTRLGG